MVEKKILLNLQNLSRIYPDEEFVEKRSTLSPEQMMYQQCTGVVFEEAVEKLKISLILPIILSNPIILERYLANTEFEGAYDVIKQFFAHTEHLEARRQHLIQMESDRRDRCLQGQDRHVRDDGTRKSQGPFLGYKPKALVSKKRDISRALRVLNRRLPAPVARKRKPMLTPYRKYYPNYEEPFTLPTKDPCVLPKYKPQPPPPRPRAPRALRLTSRVSHRMVYIVGMARRGLYRPKNQKKSETIDPRRKRKHKNKYGVPPPRLPPRPERPSQLPTYEPPPPKKEPVFTMTYEEAKAAAARRVIEEKAAAAARRTLERQKAIEDMIQPMVDSLSRPLEALDAIYAFAIDDDEDGSAEEFKRTSIKVLKRRKSLDLNKMSHHRHSQQVMLDEVQRRQELRAEQLRLFPPKRDVLKLEEDAIILRIVDYFHRHTGMLQYLPNWLDDLDERDAILLKSLELLGKMTATVMSRTALYTLQMEQGLNGMYKKNVELRRHIDQLEERLRHKATRTRWIISAKAAVRNQIILNMERKRREADEIIGREMKNCKRNMHRIDEEHAHRRETAEHELETLKYEAVKAVRVNDQAVMVVRDERNKLLIQLEAVLHKRDKVILEKFREKVNLQRQHAREAIAVHEAAETLAEVREEYRIIVTGYYTRRIETLKRRRAVRIISEWVLNIWRLRQERPKKKGKKKY